MAGKKGSSKKITSKFTEKLFKRVTTCEPLLTDEEVDRIEDSLKPTTGFSVDRRCALAAATQSGAWFKKLSEDREMAVTIAMTLDGIKNQVKALRQLAEVFETAEWRIRVALINHADMEAILAEGKAQLVGHEEASHG